MYIKSTLRLAPGAHEQLDIRNYVRRKTNQENKKRDAETKASRESNEPVTANGGENNNKTIAYIIELT